MHGFMCVAGNESPANGETTMTTTGDQVALTPGTRVLNTTDGQDGTVLSAIDRAADGRWVRYEIETPAGIEIWDRSDFIAFDEMNG